MVRLLGTAALLLVSQGPLLASAKKRSMVWIYGSDLFPEGPHLEETMAQLKLHTGSFNAVSPQMYSVGCAAAPAPSGPPPPPQHYIESSGIEYCNGAGDLIAGNAFAAGCWESCKDPLLPAAWSEDEAVRECQGLCSNSSACVGFTFYQKQGGTKGLRTCAFRTGAITQRPPCSGPTCTARCYEKAAKPPSVCAPILISDTSDPGITPDPALAKRFHALGPHIEYWPTLSSPDWLNADACKPPLCFNGTGDPTARCPCGQAPNETATMQALLASPHSLIVSAIEQAKKWNVTGYVRWGAAQRPVHTCAHICSGADWLERADAACVGADRGAERGHGGAVAVRG
jgi:hypothetical protein